MKNTQTVYLTVRPRYNSSYLPFFHCHVLPDLGLAQSFSFSRHQNAISSIPNHASKERNRKKKVILHISHETSAKSNEHRKRLVSCVTAKTNIFCWHKSDQQEVRSVTFQTVLFCCCFFFIFYDKKLK